MITIAIHGAEFFAYHGFYPEEQKLGTKFLVDIEVSYEPFENIEEDSLDNTVDYQQLYEIACTEMKHTRKLIETVAQAIAEEIKAKFGYAEKIVVVLKKMHPPMAGKVEYSSVTVMV